MSLEEKAVKGKHSTGKLFIVATPIGNLQDMSPRAQATLTKVDYIACEDTRHSKKLMTFFSISTRLVALHDHNESEQAKTIIADLNSGSSVALISDAGTPLVSDPGYRLVQMAQSEGIEVVTIPGPCALISALSIAGLPSDSFAFHGFLPAKEGQKRALLDSLKTYPHTLIFYESPKRLMSTLATLSDMFGDRMCVVARELTKQYETVYRDTVSNLSTYFSMQASVKGELVLLLEGAGIKNEIDRVLLDDVLQDLLPCLPLKQAVALVVKLTGINRNIVYERALELKP